MWLLKNESHQSLGRKKKIGENISRRSNNGMCNNKDSAHMPLEGVLSCSIASDSLRLYGLRPARLLCPWDSPGKNTGVGCLVFLQGIFPTQGSSPKSHLLFSAMAGGFLTTSTTWEFFGMEWCLKMGLAEPLESKLQVALDCLLRSFRFFCMWSGGYQRF